MHKSHKSHAKKAVIIGNPNSGKTTLFNLLTNSKSKIGNWAGVTVEIAKGYNTDINYEFLDLPGVYSLLPSKTTSYDESQTLKIINDGDYDFIINVIDQSNFERNLNLTLQLAELKKPMLIILNMADTAKRKKIAIDDRKLGNILGCQVINCSFKKRNCLKNILAELENNHHIPTIKLEYPKPLEELLVGSNNRVLYLQELVLGLRLTEQRLIEDILKEDIDLIIANARFDYIGMIIKNCQIRLGVIGKNLSYRLDRLFLNKYFGLPIFAGLMYLVFYVTMFFSNYLQDFFELFASAIFIELPRDIIRDYFSNNSILYNIADGFGGGFVTVISFIPVIATMYFLLGLFEESGYLTRAAYLMDNYLRKLSLPGKAFIPLIVGFGCNVPGILASKTIDNPQDRTTAIMMSPFMSCGARLSVYSLFCVVFFKNHGHNIIFSLYIVGIFFAILTGIILKKYIFKNVPAPLIMELPNYQIPNLLPLIENTKNRLLSFCLGAGKLIIIMFVIVHSLSKIEYKNQKIVEEIGKHSTFIFEPMGIKQDNWPAVAALLVGSLAKEIVVGTLNAFYTLEVEEHKGFEAKIKEAFEIFNKKESSDDAALKGIIKQKFANSYAVYSYLLFILLYFPCASVFSAIYSEAGPKWAYTSAIWSTILAYCVSVIFYQGYLAYIGMPLNTIAICFAIIAPLILVKLFVRLSNNATIEN